MIEGKKIFITGGAGFIGSTLIGKLIEKNQITVLDTMSRPTLQTKSYANHKNLKIVKGDVLDQKLVRETMGDAEVIVHCAGIAGIDTVIKRPTMTLNVNILGTHNVLEAAVAAGKCERLVCFSTSEVFGSHALSSKETDRTVIGAAGHARWTYAVSKLAEEHLAIAYHSEYQLPTTVVRPFNVYGPGQMGEGALKNFIDRALKNEPLRIYGEGTQIRAWCFVDDMVEGTLRTLWKKEAIGESFNIGNARSVETIYGLANTVIRVLGSKSTIEFLPALSADIELRIPNIDKAEKVLGFKAQVQLEDGILRTAEYIRKSL